MSAGRYVMLVKQVDDFDAEFDRTCDRLELKKLAETNHRAVASALEINAIEQLHRAFVYEIRTLQARLKGGQ